MIFDIQRFSTHDGPGIRTVVFFKGCPLACPWCENPESQSFGRELLYKPQQCINCASCLDPSLGGAMGRGPEGAISVRREVEPLPALAEVCPSLALRLAGEDASPEAILARVLRDRAFYEKSGGGLTFSGGEPLAQGQDLLDLARLAKAAGLDTAMETCLALPWEGVSPLLGLIDHWLVDLKHTDRATFLEVAKGDLVQILGNIEALARAGADLTLRVPVIPGFNDSEAEMGAILDFAAALPPPPGGNLRRLDLLPYHDLALGKYTALGRTYPYTPGLRLEAGRMEKLAELGRARGLAVTIGG